MHGQNNKDKNNMRYNFIKLINNCYFNDVEINIYHFIFTLFFFIDIIILI